MVLNALAAAATVEHLAGDLEAAAQFVEAYAAAAAPVTPWDRGRSLHEIARVAVAAERLDVARQLTDDFEPHALAHRAALLSALASVAEASGQMDVAAGRYREASVAWEEHGFVLERGLAQLGVARSSPAPSGERSESELAQAVDTFADLGARALLDRLEALPAGTGPAGQ